MEVPFIPGTMYGPYLIFIRLAPATFDVLCWITRIGAAPAGADTLPPLPALLSVSSYEPRWLEVYEPSKLVAIPTI